MKKIAMTDLQKDLCTKIENIPVIVFSKSFCPECNDTKALLNKGNVAFKVFELDQVENGAEYIDHLELISGQRSVPNIWIAGKFVGGHKDLEAKIESGVASHLFRSAKVKTAF